MSGLIFTVGTPCRFLGSVIRQSTATPCRKYHTAVMDEITQTNRDLYAATYASLQSLIETSCVGISQAGGQPFAHYPHVCH